MGDKPLDLVIRRASEKDDAVLADFSRRTFETAFGPDNDPDEMRFYLDESFSLAKIAEELTDPGTIFLLAYHHETLAGYAKLQEGPPPDCVSDREPVQLSRLYVMSQYMGKGFGSQLIQACFDESRQRGYKTIWLGAWEKNLNAHRLYERCGLARVGTKTFVLGTDVQQDAVFERSLGISTD
jgi:ribosomal protein S18 acetylase RimI-like enzyme